MTESAKNATLDSIAIGAIGTGVAMVSALGEKWWVGLVLVAVGVGLSYMKYKLRG